MSIGVNVGRSGQRNAVQRPEKPDRIREALALVDAAYQPHAAEHTVIDVMKPGVWFRRGRLLIVSPDSLGTACPLSGRNSTYRLVQILEAGSVLTPL